MALGIYAPAHCSWSAQGPLSRSGAPVTLWGALDIQGSIG